MATPSLPSPRERSRKPRGFVTFDAEHAETHGSALAANSLNPALSFPFRRDVLGDGELPTGPETVFSEAEVDDIVDILKAVRTNAIPTDGAA
jgi:hypothetical protein